MISFETDQKAVPRSHRITRATLDRLAHALKKELPKWSGSISLTFVDDEEIRRLNRMYRQKDKVTDVLSFPSGDAELSGELGDVLISYDQAVRQALDGDITLELADLLVHGVLHVLGYDHERPEDADEMFPLQDRLVAAIL